jgi:hypothetical protein
MFSALIAGLFSEMDGAVGKLTEAGMALTGLLFVIAIAWEGIMVAISGESVNSAISKVIKLTMTTGIVLFFLTGQVADPINKSFDKIAEMISGGASTSVTEAAGQLVKTVMTVAEGNVDRTLDAAGVTAATQPGQSVQDRVTAWWNSLSIGMLFQLQLERLLSILMSIPIALAGALYIAAYLIAILSIKLALVLAPVMAPWLLLGPTKFLFDGWLRFFLGAGMQKVVGSFFFVVTYKLLEGAAKIAANGASMGDALGSYLLAILLAVICCWLMLQVPSISAGLISGHGGQGGLGRLPGIPKGIK